MTTAKTQYGYDKTHRRLYVLLIAVVAPVSFIYDSSACGTDSIRPGSVKGYEDESTKNILSSMWQKNGKNNKDINSSYN